MIIDPQMLQSQSDLGQLIITLMGTSFILGSLITILLLMLVDFLHHRFRPGKEL